MCVEDGRVWTECHILPGAVHGSDVGGGAGCLVGDILTALVGGENLATGEKESTEQGDHQT